jgi:6-phosphofructokinase 1
VATRRCFVVEVMGHWTGYLALMSGISTGAERVYVPEEGITLDEMRADVEMMRRGFKAGKRLGLIIRSEYANMIYTTPFMCSLYEEEGGDLFDARPAILGHLQQGGDPSPFDRIQATRLTRLSLEYLVEQCTKGETNCAFIGMQKGQLAFHDMFDFERITDREHERPREHWWLELKGIAALMAKPGPG